MQQLTPDEIGREIRRLLLSLVAPGHDDSGPWSNYGTDALRRRALEVAGICWLDPGEMTPKCGCDWSPEDPTGAAKRVEEDHAERKMLWDAVTNDGCAVSRVTTRVCSKGTRGCVSGHRQGTK